MTFRYSVPGAVVPFTDEVTFPFDVLSDTSVTYPCFRETFGLPSPCHWTDRMTLSESGFEVVCSVRFGDSYDTLEDPVLRDPRRRSPESPKGQGRTAGLQSRRASGAITTVV